MKKQSTNGDRDEAVRLNQEVLFVLEARSQAKTSHGYGICTADRYVGGVVRSFFRGGGLESPEDIIKESRAHLTYMNEDMGAEGFYTNDSDIELYCKKRGIEKPVHTLMIFENVVTTPKKDRDGDILRTEGAEIDPFMPLLWHHIPSMPVGKMIKVLVHNKKRLVVATAVIDSALGHDVAALVEFGALRISHGFRPLEFEALESKEEDGEPVGLDIKRFEIMEQSVVSVPSNTDAVISAADRGKLSDPMVKQWASSLRKGTPASVAVKGLPEVIDEKDAKPYENEHSCRIHSPNLYDEWGQQTRKHDGKKYRVIRGRRKDDDEWEDQAFRYNKEVWTEGDAKKHCKDHEGILFEPASGEDESCADEMCCRDAHDETKLDYEVKFAGSPRNPFGTHSSYKFKGGTAGYKKAWRLHFSQINGGALTPAASGPIRGTVRRTEMIAAGMKPPCDLPAAENIDARAGSKSPLSGAYPQKPSDYGLDRWDKPEGDEDRKGIVFSCGDLETIKRAATQEVKRRIADREAEEEKAKYYGPVAQSWEWVKNELETSVLDYLRSQGVPVPSDDPWIDVVATFDDHAIVTVRSSNTEETAYEIAWEMRDNEPQWTGEPKEVELSVEVRRRAVGDERSLNTKSGRVLSSKNKQRLAQAGKLIEEVLATAGIDEEEETRETEPTFARLARDAAWLTIDRQRHERTELLEVAHAILGNAIENSKRANG